ncbi:heavy metal translocating P-type ATPase, partial [Escherichia coli]|nr:heavy metal translocating P-type ATPase [Escherichia coli]
VRHGPGTDAGAIAATVRGLGYGVADPDATAASGTEAAELPWWRAPKALLAFACGAALALAYVFGHAVPATDQWAFLAAMAIGLVPVGRRALAAARHGTPFSIETLMTVAAVGATLIGATEEAAT